MNANEYPVWPDYVPAIVLGWIVGKVIFWVWF